MGDNDRKLLPFVSVVISFFNEERVIPELITRLRRVFSLESEKGLISGYELIFVNDASTDGSWELLLKEQIQGKDLLLVDMTRNFGVSECVLAGFSIARGDVIIYMDADLQDPPEIIPKMLTAWREDSEVEIVYTTRLRREGEHPLKVYLTKLGYRILKNISHIDIPVDSGDFKLLSRTALDTLLKFDERYPYLRGMVSWIGYKQAQVFYVRDERFDGKSCTKRPMYSSQVINYFLDQALTSFSDFPIKLILFSGLGMLVIAVVLGLIALSVAIFSMKSSVWLVLSPVLLFVTALILISIGIVGLYINVIFAQTKRRPLYLIKKILGPYE